MKSTFIFSFFCLICYGLLGSAAPFSKRQTSTSTSTFNTNIFEPFKAYAETPKNVVRDYAFELKRVSMAPDGFTRDVWTVNGQYPGPMIRANKGDTFNITVTNRFGGPSTIHWHGLDQKGSNWFDGVPGVTQCPIQDGVTFSYVFNITQAGTFWYHSHFIAQYVDGLRGPIVIHDPDDPYKSLYDDEYVMTVSDWYHLPTEDPGMVPLFRSENYHGGDPLPDSGEISGVGQYNCTIPNCEPTRFATYNVTSGRKYRFRIINVSAMAHFRVSIDNHPMQIIEVEGTLIKPVVVNVLSVNIAQRYSVIIEATQPVGNYWIRANMSACSVRSRNPQTINFNETRVFENMNITGILRYDGAPNTIPTSQPYPAGISDCADHDPATLNPVSPTQTLPTESPATTITLEVSVRVSPVLEALMNNSTFKMNFNYPSNQKVIDGVGFNTSENAYSYDVSGKVVEILLNNTEQRTHPFHLHGHSFWVVAQGDVGSYNKSLSSLTYNLNNPILRDTVTLKDLSLTAIRYRADNPGVWLIHCHIEWHVEMGMVAQLIESPSEFSKLTIPGSVKALCQSPTNHGYS